MTLRYPHVTVILLDEDSNAFVVLGRVLKALKRAGVPVHERNEFVTEATSGDYDNLMRTVMQWVRVE